MYSKIAGVLTPILAVAVIGLGMWGYQENQEKNSILIKAENQYQRAFHDLTFHMDQLQDELGKTLAINSRRQIDGTMSNVWRISSVARSDVGQLPLALMSFSKTEEFLAKIGDFAYKTAVRDLNKDPLSEKEYENLKTLHSRAVEIQSELRRVQSKVIDQKLRWMDVESALASEEENLDNTIIDGFRTIDKTVNEYSDIDFGPGIQTLQNKERFSDKNLTGKKITEEEAKKIALQFLGIQAGQANVKVDRGGKGHEYSAISVAVTKPAGNNTIHLDVTKKGGHVVWMINNRNIAKQKLDIQQAVQKGKAFLEKHGLKNMENYTTEQYDNTAVLSYVYSQNGVRIYPDALTVKVALDTGEVVGYQAEQFIFNHKENRKFVTPKLSMKQARKEVNPNFKVQESRKAVVLNDNNDEVLCYEFMGTVSDQAFRIFINVENGDEEVVEKLDKPGKIG
ncbi:germination protein YpeB [Ammoniphilus resinae]|uniref:Spore germination protein n=1 Tax=Ammoniphilus resinae TaxID=861532 RepID=A0ABS4GT77_9BACL|nr:germination protein YpeB [Ammoniphilus resinae]MBP1933481.1 spore germination protein [Ammoniphilus resinae]